MKNLTLLYCLVTTIVTGSLFAQKDTLWYDANWGETERTQASYFRPAPEKKDNGYWWEDYYIGGVKQMEALSLKENEEVFHGKVTWFHPNGKVMQTVHYIENIPHGLRKNYFEKGSLKSEYTYVNGKINGDYVAYYENAQLSESGKYSNGNRVGNWKEYYQNGKLKAEGTYTNDTKTGTWQVYYYDGMTEN
ncbi:toxin-antitoxin system YwqK family antitoxin [Aureibaculum marinum]|uniref:Toxin-antitoxin system YwqK family antitoxin n=1 Tax=Aureibaculum marinum TaxID=2487930 RepID=A0A3N4NPZ5_9FLAO|nr:toxin-antitoxin system YwqK family antitoxin [Aureibaculum marinum]RPD96587.1 toxin-antitoxin system YwqK family antitoxin [Aureibaculum marinum]